jgi:microcystin-dependent protein
MEGTIGEIRLFAASFAPNNWEYCQGQIIAIQSNAALFSILGTTFGGDGKTNFALPNMSNNVAVGAGLQASPGLKLRTLGEKGGTNNVTLDLTQLPAHTHALTARQSVSVNNTTAATETPVAGDTIGNSVLANGTPLNSYIAATPNIALNSATAAITAMNLGQGSPVGGSQAHPNQQPSLGMGFVICVRGLFPPRQ